MTKQHNSIPLWTVLLFIAVIYAAMSLLTPLVFDDMQFRSIFVHSMRSDGLKGFWEGYTGYISTLFMEDNIRLSNCLDVFSVLSPASDAVFGILAGIAAAAMYWLCARFIAGDKPDWRAVALVWLGGTLFLPWRDMMFVNIFYANYVFGALLLFAFWWALQALKTLPSIALAIALGWWHEGFAVAALGGMAFVTLKWRFRPGRLMWLCAVLVFASAAAAMCCPGMLSRMGLENSRMAMSHGLVKVAVNNCLVIVMLGLMAIMLLRSRWRAVLSKVLVSDNAVFFLGAALAGAMLCLFIRSNPRTGFAPQLCSLIVIGMLMHGIHFSRRLITVFASAALVLCLAHGAYACYWAHRFDVQHRELVQAVKDSDDGTVYSDIIMPEDCPTQLTLNFPIHNAWVSDYHYMCLNRELPQKQGSIAVVPTALVGDLSAGEVIGDGVWRLGDAMYTERRPFTTLSDMENPNFGIACALVRFEDAPDVEHVLNVFSIRFCGRDGKEWYYMKILDRNLGSRAVSRIKLLQ